jgi:hypothetical protein
MVDRELRAQLPWSTAVFGHRRRLLLPISTEEADQTPLSIFISVDA